MKNYIVGWLIFSSITLILLFIVSLIVDFKIKQRYPYFKRVMKYNHLDYYTKTLLLWIRRIVFCICPIVNVVTLLALLFMLNKKMFERYMDKELDYISNEIKESTEVPVFINLPKKKKSQG